MALLAHQERVVAEQTDLQNKINGLYAFTVGDAFSSVTKVEQSLLEEQLQHMIAYNHSLLCRIEIFQKAAA